MSSLPSADSADTAAADRKKSTRRVEPESNVKETVESILLAFILAFIFRAFVVEAFVIPTGSMAPTLLGAHMRFRCPDCGYVFDVDFSTGKESMDEDSKIPNYAMLPVKEDGVDKMELLHYDNPNGARLDHSIFCPNCGRQIPTSNPLDPDNDATAPAVYYGDRILVLKYLYLFQAPHRWDVVVFKAPTEDSQNYTVNFIKRLVGLPGETVLLLDGDVYSRAPGADHYEIRRKPYSVQRDLWRLVYDNDYVPQGLPGPRPTPWRQPWQPRDGSGWTLTRPGAAGAALPSRVFRFDNPTAAGAVAFNPIANPSIHPLGDAIAYDQTWPHELIPQSDLRLHCFYSRKSGDGPFDLELTKGKDAFKAELLPGRARLLHSADGGRKFDVLYDVAVPELSRSEPAELEFANCDYRVWLRVDGREIFATTDAQYHPFWEDILKVKAWQDLMAEPDWQNLLTRDAWLQRLGHPDWVRIVSGWNYAPPTGRARIAAARQQADVTHLSLMRDIYYTNHNPPGATPVVWGCPGNAITLGAHPNEYFVLGDNSPISGDARYWRSPVHLPAEQLDVEPGRVPQQFMLGKAFYVYWPAGYRAFGKKFGLSYPHLNPGIIPNFGEMRSIH